MARHDFLCKIKMPIKFPGTIEEPGYLGVRSRAKFPASIGASGQIFDASGEMQRVSGMNEKAFAVVCDHLRNPKNIGTHYWQPEGHSFKNNSRKGFLKARADQNIA
jgi:hypothetical protein